MTEANPAHWLAFRRFPSAQVMAFHRAQMDSIRAFPPGRDVTHNAMGFFTDYDHHALGRDLDVIGWDSFPLGVLEQFYFSDDDRRRYARQGHPDIATFHHDLYRGCCTGERWTVPEQQPGRVNRARYTPPPLPGMVTLWTVEAAAHGAEFVSYSARARRPSRRSGWHPCNALGGSESSRPLAPRASVIGRRADLRANDTRVGSNDHLGE